MGKKDKVSKGPQQQHLYSRISYLYQAAAFLATTQTVGQKRVHLGQKSSTNDVQESCGLPSMIPLATSEQYGTQEPVKKDIQADHVVDDKRPPQTTSSNHSRRLVNSLNAVSRKGLVRLTPEMRRTLCKRCDSLLLPGISSIHSIENTSKDGKKPWADVVCIECSSCGARKRFPIGAARQSRKTSRPNKPIVTAASPEAPEPP